MVRLGTLVVTKEEMVEKAHEKEIELIIIDCLGELVVQATSESDEVKERLGMRPTLERMLSEIFEEKIIKFICTDDLNEKHDFLHGDFMMYYVIKDKD